MADYARLKTTLPIKSIALREKSPPKNQTSKPKHPDQNIVTQQLKRQPKPSSQKKITPAKMIRKNKKLMKILLKR